MNVKEAILEAAIIEFGEEGFKGCSTNEIVRRSGVAKGSIFHHFNHKQGLYEAACLRVLNGVADALEAKIDASQSHETHYYFKVRQNFLKENKEWERLFYRLLWEDLSGYSPELNLAMSRLKKINQEYLKVLLIGKVIRDGLSDFDVMQVIEDLQSMIAVKFFNGEKITEQDVDDYNNYSMKMFDYVLNGMSEVLPC